MIKVIQELPDDTKKQIIKDLDALGKISSFGEYVKFSYQELAEMSSMIEGYAFHEHGYAIIDTYLDRLNVKETDFLRAISNTKDKQALTKIKHDIRKANKRCSPAVLAILAGKKKKKAEPKLSLENTFKQLQGLFS